MIERIEKFKTSDGTEFSNELDAYKHECECLKKQLIHNSDEKILVTKNGIKIEYKEIYSIEDLINHNIKLPDYSGIYMWFNLRERLGYVGSAENIRIRCSSFCYQNAKYAGKKIEEARKNNLFDFVFLVLEIVNDDTKLIERENYHIEKYDLIKNGYNSSKAIENPFRIEARKKKEMDLFYNLEDDFGKVGKEGMFRRFDLNTSLSELKQYQHENGYECLSDYLGDFYIPENLPFFLNKDEMMPFTWEEKVTGYYNSEVIYYSGEIAIVIQSSSIYLDFYQTALKCNEGIDKVENNDEYEADWNDEENKFYGELDEESKYGTTYRCRCYCITDFNENNIEENIEKLEEHDFFWEIPDYYFDEIIYIKNNIVVAKYLRIDDDSSYISYYMFVSNEEAENFANYVSAN